VLRVDVAVEVGPITEVVNVDAPAIAVNTEDPQLGKVVRDPAGLPVLSGANDGMRYGWRRTRRCVRGQLASQDEAVLGQRPAVQSTTTCSTAPTPTSRHSRFHAIDLSERAEEFRIITGAMKAEYISNTGAVAGSDSRGQTRFTEAPRYFRTRAERGAIL
jgi:hypothetical protein